MLTEYGWQHGEEIKTTDGAYIRYWTVFGELVAYSIVDYIDGEICVKMSKLA